jgi:hypothetical protein
MDKYFDDFVRVIESIEHDNTYKTAWGRAIVECVVNNEYEEEGTFIVVTQYYLVQKLMKYYWNLIVFFDLSQGPSKLLNTRIEEIREDFYTATKISYPVWYDKIEAYLTRNPVRMERQIKKFITFVNKGVASKFERIDHKRVELYDLDVKQRCIRFTETQIDSIKRNESILLQVIDYKWAKLLEEYNKSPNLIKKVIGSKEAKLSKKGHLKFRNIIVEYSHFEGIKDFYTGEHLSIDNVALDYVIPYYFIYSTDIWNVVLTSKENAKVKRGVQPTQEEIDKLNKRNRVLIETLGNTKLHARFELENSQINHLLNRYYTDYKG